MHIALIDDEQHYIDILFGYLIELGESISNIKLEIDSFNDGASFLLKAARTRYDIIFLDIFMHHDHGIDIAREFRKIDPECLLVFSTSSTEYMPEAFSTHAFEYIVKPFTKERVLQVMKDALSSIEKPEPFISLTINNKTHKILLKEILSCVTDSHYLNVNTRSQGTYRYRSTMDEFIKGSNYDSRFIMINRGILINIEEVTQLDESSISLKTGLNYPVRTRSYQDVWQAIHDYRFAKLRGQQKYR